MLPRGSGAAQVRTGLGLLDPLQSEEPQPEEESCAKPQTVCVNELILQLYDKHSVLTNSLHLI